MNTNILMLMLEYKLFVVYNSNNTQKAINDINAATKQNRFQDKYYEIFK